MVISSEHAHRNLTMPKPVNITEERWDYLVVLDACGYDYFSRLYGGYLRGELTRVVSQGSFTVEWFKKSSPDRYDDVVYISSNPYINSKVEVGVSSQKTTFSRSSTSGIGVRGGNLAQCLLTKSTKLCRDSKVIIPTRD